MNPSIDLNLLLLARQGTDLISELPDLYAVTPPRRTARGRESDSLIIYMTMTGNSPLSPEAQTQLLEQLAHKFYKTTGSLTAAMRTIVEALNLYLLDRNLRSTSMGRQGIGQLLLLALRSDTLYLAQCGTVHAFVITQEETRHLYDPQSSGRGLGLSRTTPIRFLQTKLSPGDYLVLATKASPSWSETTLRVPLGVEGLRSQLLESSGQDINAVIVQSQPGTGKLRMLRRKIEAPEALRLPMDGVVTASTETPTTPIRAQESPVEDHQLEIPEEEIAPVLLAATPEQANVVEIPTTSATPEEIAEETVEEVAIGEETREIVADTAPPVPVEMHATAAPVEETAPVASSTTPISETVSEPGDEISPIGILAEQPSTIAEAAPDSAEPPIRQRRERPAPKPAPWARLWASLSATVAPVLSSILRAVRSALGTISAATLRLLKNLLPDADILHVPTSLMVFIAIAIPLILAVAGGMVFLQRGRAQQYQIYYQQASEQAGKAASLTNPLEQRVALQGVIDDLDKAEYYTVTSQSQELRNQVTTQLDTLDAVKRIDYKQAIIDGLDSEIVVTRMIATTTDLYLLNGKQGTVLRAFMTALGYEIDPNFQCGPTYGPINVGPLVDIAELPPGSFENATVLGMDANGNLLYCVVGSQPYSAIMAPPNTGFGEPSGMTLDQGDLYVLDSKVNAVWIYRNMEVTQQPRLFFGDMIPPMQDVIDLAVYNDDLFLLHADGHITKCVFSTTAASPTRCDDPYPYSDNRPGRVHSPVIADSVFNQLYYSSFPERSLFMLDPQNQAIFYFSVLMTLQWQYQPKTALVEGKATSFAISPNRMVFLAMGNNVYYAAMP